MHIQTYDLQRKLAKDQHHHVHVFTGGGISAKVNKPNIAVMHLPLVEFTDYRKWLQTSSPFCQCIFKHAQLKLYSERNIFLHVILGSLMLTDSQLRKSDKRTNISIIISFHKQIGEKTNILGLNLSWPLIDISTFVCAKLVLKFEEGRGLKCQFEYSSNMNLVLKTFIRMGSE